MYPLFVRIGDGNHPEAPREESAPAVAVVNVGDDVALQEFTSGGLSRDLLMAVLRNWSV
jgi:hypothetical protein